jgi:hypothetical protein
MKAFSQAIAFPFSSPNFASALLTGYVIINAEA